MGKNSNTDLSIRDRDAEMARKAKKKAKKTGTKKAPPQNFSMVRAKVDDKFALEHMPTGVEAGTPQERKFVVIALDKNGDSIREDEGDLEFVQNSWPSFKGWAFGAKFGEFIRLPGSAKNPEMEAIGLREFSVPNTENVIRLGRGWIRRVA